MVEINISESIVNSLVAMVVFHPICGHSIDVP